jgi:hypothetical protein
MTRATVALLGAALLLVGCASGTSPDLEDLGVPADAVRLPDTEIVSVVHDSDSGLLTRERFVLESAEQWATVWSTLLGGRTPKPPVPIVDFAKDVVLVASMGGRPVGGADIDVVARYANASGVWVVVEETRYDMATCVLTPAEIAPVHAVVVPRPTVPVHFVTKEINKQC